MLLAMTLAALLVPGLASGSEQSPAASPNGGHDPLPLADALARVRERAPHVAAARARQRASALARSVLPALPNPVIEFRGENLGPSATTSLDRDVFATVSQPFELAGRRRARISEADALVKVAEAEVARAEWALAFEVAETYVSAVRARKVMAALVAQRHDIAELVRVVEARVGEGVAAESDLHKFRTEQIRLTSQVTRVSVTLRSALLRLSALVGQDVHAEQLVVPAVAASTASARPFNESAVVDRRPDVQIASTRLRRAEATAAVERSLRVPDVAVTAGYKRTGGFDTAVAGVSVAVPLFNRNRPAIAYATGEVTAAGLDLEQTRQHALADARARWSAAEELGAHSARMDRDLLEPARIVRAAARTAFIEGRGDVLQLVDAERVYAEAVREALELQLDAILALIHARLSAGESPLP